MRTIGCSMLVMVVFLTAGCAGTITAPRTAVSPPAPDALLILPGFGYSADGERALRALAPAMRADGLDLYVPDFIARGGLEQSRHNLHRFIGEQRLERYERVHVFAFLAGAWTFNPLVEDARLLPNLATVVYDRSPYQERAPRIAADRLRFLAWIRYGPVIFDLAKAPYPPLPRASTKVGLLVETVPTPFVRKRAAMARAYGAYAFECAALAQPYDDCIFVPLHHTEFYTRFGEAWPEVRTFIRTGRFSASARRVAPRVEVP
jgi:hypothetical protein